MVEEFIERYEAISRRTKLLAAGGVLLALVILGVGLNTIISGFLKGRPHVAGAKTPAAQGKATTYDKTAKLAAIGQADFAYLVPDPSADWTVDEHSEAYDKSKKVVKYDLRLANAGTAVTVSQQELPSQLSPRSSAAFKQFVESNKPTRSIDVGRGTLYYLPALSNGAPAAGADTVIYATNEVLLFGRAERVVGYDGWSKLMGAMKAN